MSKNIYSSEQIKALLKNKNIKNCTSKAITYTKQFKVRAVQEYYQDGLSPNMIFKKAGLDLNIIGRMQPKECLKRWRKIYKAKGEQELRKENRGKNGGHRVKLPESDNIEYLKTKIKYLEAENSFLKKLKTNKSS
jgi:transposase-like protein